MTHPAPNEGLQLAAEFPAAGEAQWRALVDKALKGGDFERRLVRTTADGIPVRPLYTSADATPLPGWPGAAPFTRGASPAGAGIGGWDVRQRHAAGDDPAATNAAILEDLGGGVTSIQLRLDAEPTGALLDRALAGVVLDAAPVGLDAGGWFAPAATAFLDLARRRGHGRESVRADLNADPLGAAVAGGPLEPDAGMVRAVGLAREVAAGWPAVAALTADGRPYHAGGASEGQEIAFAVATGIAYLRALVEDAGGLAADAAARQVGFALAADADFFPTVAKFRALRRLWGRVLEVAGAAAAMPALRLHAETAERMLTRVDPHVNILRGTVATFAAAAGGATSVTTLPFDHAAPGPPAPLARRIARNTQLVLLEESNLGRVIDPAGGSWYVERLTEELAAKAWSLVQEIERRGGMLAALREGWPQDLVAASREELEADAATRRRPITGVSEFPDADEPPRKMPDPGPAVPDATHLRPIPAFRLSAAFERVRARGDAVLERTGQRLRVHLCNLGRPEEFAARANFARNLFEAGGFAVVAGEASTSAERLARDFAASGAALAAICSSDHTYDSVAEPLARALRGARAARIYLMGRPDEARGAAWLAAGVDEFVHAGPDMLALLERAHAVAAGGAQ